MGVADIATGRTVVPDYFKELENSQLPNSNLQHWELEVGSWTFQLKISCKR